MTRVTRGKAFFLALSLVLATALVAGGWLAAQPGSESPGGDSIYKYLSVFTEAFAQIRQSYVDETRSEELLAAAFDGVSDALDPFSLYVPATAVERHRQARAVGSSRSGVQLLKERGVPYVVAVDQGGAAAAAGLEPGDLVAEIDGRPTRAVPLWELRALLAAPEGTQVALQLLRRGEPLRVTLTLRQTPPAPATLSERGGVPILRLPAFGPGTPKEVEALLKALPESTDPSRLIVDLRGTAAGETASAYGVAAAFAAGDLGVALARGVEEQSFKGANPAWTGTLVVLVDRATLGAAEILATVLRQAAGARLVGERTFGYAGRQKIVELAAGGALEITDAFYTGPDRKRLERGLRPDVLVDERSRSFADRDTPVQELILERGLEVVLEDVARAA